MPASVSENFCEAMHSLSLSSIAGILNYAKIYFSRAYGKTLSVVKYFLPSSSYSSFIKESFYSTVFMLVFDLEKECHNIQCHDVTLSCIKFKKSFFVQ